MPTREDWGRLENAIENRNLSDLVQLGPRFSLADINGEFPRYSWTPLTFSIFFGCSVPIVQHLVREMGADPDKPDGTGMSPLAWAVEEDTHELLMLLLDLNADPNLKLNIDDWNVKL